MKNRLALIPAFACAVFLQASVMPAAAQESAQTVKAAIPPQAATPPSVNAAPQARPTVAQPQVIPPRVDPAPGPKTMMDTEAANVKVEVTITYQVGNAAPVKRLATLTVADQGRGSLRAGNQVAVTSTTFMPTAAGGPATTPMNSYSYKSVGLNLDARAAYIQGNKAKLELSIEFSSIDEKTSDSAGHLPSFPTFSQNLTLVLESGKPLIVGQSSDFVDNVERRQTVEVKATILR
jgi:hypothetical protein